MMTFEEILKVATELEPQLRDWLSDRIIELELDPRDGVRVMVVVASLLTQHLEWLTGKR